MIWLILFIIVIIVACFVVYKTAEVHELHKIRAAFDIKRHDIEKLIQDKANGVDPATRNIDCNHCILYIG